MDVKEAVQAAKVYLIDLFDDESIDYVGLEEIEFDDVSNQWKITIGFSRPWNRRSAFVAPVGERAIDRSYKLIRVKDNDGRVVSLTDRVLSASSS